MHATLSAASFACDVARRVLPLADLLAARFWRMHLVASANALVAFAEPGRPSIAADTEPVSAGEVVDPGGDGRVRRCVPRRRCGRCRVRAAPRAVVLACAAGFPHQ